MPARTPFGRWMLSWEAEEAGLGPDHSQRPETLAPKEVTV